MPAEQITTIEMAMRDYVTVVSYDCKQLTLLDQCKVEGAYGFLPAAPPPEVTRVSRVENGETFTLATVRGGEMRTTWELVRRADLRGLCGGATHVIRGALLGAFEMSKEAPQRQVVTKAGDVAQCAAIEPSARRRHPFCQNVLELLLLPVAP